MTLGFEVLVFLANVGILGWIIRVERRLTAIETTCKLRNENGRECHDAL